MQKKQKKIFFGGLKLIRSQLLPNSSVTASPSYRRQPCKDRQATFVPDRREQVRFSGSIFPSKASSSTVALTRTTGRDLDKEIGLLNVLFDKIIDNSNYLISMEELFRATVSTFSKGTLTIL
jgi:hypothetical protein